MLDISTCSYFDIRRPRRRPCYSRSRRSRCGHCICHTRHTWDEPRPVSQWCTDTREPPRSAGTSVASWPLKEWLRVLLPLGPPDRVSLWLGSGWSALDLEYLKIFSWKWRWNWGNWERITAIYIKYLCSKWWYFSFSCCCDDLSSISALFCPEHK